LLSRLAAADPPARAPSPPPPPAPIGATAEIDRVIATVDGTPIWKSQVDEALAPVLASDPKAFRGELEPKAIEHLIEGALVANRGKALHLEVDDKEVDEAIKSVMDENHVDAGQLAQALVQNGLTMPVYREEIRRQLLEGRAFHMWLGGQSIEPTSEEIERATAEIKAAGTAQQPTRDQVHDLVLDQKLSAARSQWIAQLRRTARIERR
jgi:peptidyl-prolyl cis-trans isomerase SurA